MIDHKNHYARYCELISLAASSAPARQRDGGYMAAVYILSADKTLCDIARRKICPDGISFPGILSVARRAELSDSQFTAIRSAHNLFNGGSSSSVTPYDLALCDYLDFGHHHAGHVYLEVRLHHFRRSRRQHTA